MLAIRGINLIYQPPYHPQYNTCEMCFRQLKGWLHKYSLFSETYTEVAIFHDMSTITPTMSKKFFSTLWLTVTVISNNYKITNITLNCLCYCIFLHAYNAELFLCFMHKISENLRNMASNQKARLTLDLAAKYAEIIESITIKLSRKICEFYRSTFGP